MNCEEKKHLHTENGISMFHIHLHFENIRVHIQSDEALLKLTILSCGSDVCLAGAIYAHNGPLIETFKIDAVNAIFFSECDRRPECSVFIDIPIKESHKWI